MKLRVRALVAAWLASTIPASAFDPNPNSQTFAPMRFDGGGMFGQKLYPTMEAMVTTTGSIAVGSRTLTLAPGASVANGDSVYADTSGEIIGTIASGGGTNVVTLVGPARLSYEKAAMRVGLPRWDLNSYVVSNVVAARNIYVGLAAKGRSSWLPLVGAGGYDYPEVSRLTVLGNSVAATFGVRTSDLNSGLGAVHATAYFSLIDTPANPVDGRPNSSTTRYLQAGNTPASSGGSTMMGEESSMLNFWPVAEQDPFNVNPVNGVRNQRFDCGWGLQSSPDFKHAAGYTKFGYPPGSVAKDCSAALDIVYNDARYRSGITIGDGALDTGGSRLAPAIAMPPKVGLTWYAAAARRSWDVTSTATSGYGKLDFRDGTAEFSSSIALEGSRTEGRSVDWTRNGIANLSLAQTKDAAGDLVLATFNDGGKLIEIPFRIRRGDGKTFLTKLNLRNLPTSTSGLSSGDLWRDPANANVLKVVP